LHEVFRKYKGIQGRRCQRQIIIGRIVNVCLTRGPAKKLISGEPGNDASEHYCPGGGRVLTGYGGSLAACDHLSECPADQICNPQYGVCCTKIRTCPRPTKTIINAGTSKPIICQLKFGRITSCPDGGYCETKTGFCCKDESGTVTSAPSGEDLNTFRKCHSLLLSIQPDHDNCKRCFTEDLTRYEVEGTTSRARTAAKRQLGSSAPKKKKTFRKRSRLVKTRPWLDEECTARDGCEGGAACTCDVNEKCRCDCPTELGYTRSADRRTCQRIRRRLKEKCKTDMECSAAFSECSTGGCRCRNGFQRDGKGGCKPINSSSLLADWLSSNRDDCPDEYYCVPLFDDTLKPGYYQGFCCPSPIATRPVCPVGVSHETSFPPDYGCFNCPAEYYCHRDVFLVEKSICCPKPCISLEDIYHDGQCYPTAFYGDSCHINSQCLPLRNSSDEFSESSPLQCIKGVCACPTGFSHMDGECKRVMCTIGLRGEPSVDRNNQLVRCDRSADCSQGQMCDPNTHVCCKGANR
uniref:EB domain-containing protein n=1 Tax=Angiostrongylus cantonensis TaxID=6313 RepID=A0A0K0DA08_ANGCA